MTSLHCELLAPDQLVFKGAVRSVALQGVEGDFLVLPGHSAIITALRPGQVNIEGDNGEKMRFFVQGGFVDVQDGVCIVLAETAVAVTGPDI